MELIRAMAIARLAAGWGMTSATQVLTRGEQPYIVPNAKMVRTYWVVLSLTVVTAMKRIHPKPESPVQNEDCTSASCLAASRILFIRTCDELPLCPEFVRQIARTNDVYQCCRVSRDGVIYPTSEQECFNGDF